MTKSNRVKKMGWDVAICVGAFVGMSAAAIGLAGLPAAAQLLKAADGYMGPGRYEIESVASGKVLDLNAGDRRTVQQWSRAHQKNQQWDIVDAGDGYVYIKSAEEGAILDIDGGNARDGARVVAVRLDNRDSKMWKIEGAGEGEVRIMSRFGKALDLPQGSRQDGAPLQVWKAAPQDNQRFRLVRVGGSEYGFTAPNTAVWGSNFGDERSSYEEGYTRGSADAGAQLRRTYGRHKARYNPQWEQAFIEGYYDGYDRGRADTTTFRAVEKDCYDDGYRAGRQDYQQGQKSNYTRYAGRFDLRLEPFFRRGYADGYYSDR